MVSKKKFAAGDLVRIASLPVGDESSPVWKPDPSGPHLGIVIDEKDMQHMSAIVGQCLVVELDNGQLVTLSANLMEHAIRSGSLNAVDPRYKR